VSKVGNPAAGDLEPVVAGVGQPGVAQHALYVVEAAAAHDGHVRILPLDAALECHPHVIVERCLGGVIAQRRQRAVVVEEVLGVARDVEAHQVAGQHPAQQLSIPGKQAEDVVGREGNVEEERESRVRPVGADQVRGEHQLVVVDPHQVVALALGLDGVGEALVHALVCVEVLPLEAGVGRERVEQGPQRAVGEAVEVVGRSRAR
jgi:hypothetical protein